MNWLLSLLNCFIVASLYFDSAKTAHIPNEKPRRNEVIKFMEVWNKSYCRPIETLIDILQEHPNEVEYIFKPSCVLLMRCGGCCNDEGLECVPTEVHDVTMEVMKIKPHQGDHISQMNFVQHSKCICRPKKERRETEKSHCEPCSEKRKHLFIQDPESCKCSCKFTHLRCKSKRLELNEHSCRCEKPRRRHRHEGQNEHSTLNSIRFLEENKKHKESFLERRKKAVCDLCRYIIKRPSIIQNTCC
ncbi:vascular endothelial growth factor Ab isoform X1 [Carcharodon carcharias]|uniref:vascular endothelial growth factor Ab isoform X1 n=2 Tax=Carcharodon carcharias TaxID=13397 RepID=UPI001B7F41AE|nr:vascular endothelial growth factor Ab isoform X1 [Carcharodon carcharias]